MPLDFGLLSPRHSEPTTIGGAQINVYEFAFKKCAVIHRQSTVPRIYVSTTIRTWPLTPSSQSVVGCAMGGYSGCVGGEQRLLPCDVAEAVAPNARHCPASGLRDSRGDLHSNGATKFRPRSLGHCGLVERPFSYSFLRGQRSRRQTQRHADQVAPCWPRIPGSLELLLMQVHARRLEAIS
jgi:hypothetical protein